jgi:acyl-CoA synthetase (AMP-forming)/AMP-acid ligase II
MNGPTLFDLSSVFSAVAGAVPDQDMLVWRERRLVTDVVVVGRPSPRWGSEAVAIIALNAETSVTDNELIDTCQGSIAGYKIPKAFIRAPMIIRSPAGKADYRWAAALAAAHT